MPSVPRHSYRSRLRIGLLAAALACTVFRELALGQSDAIKARLDEAAALINQRHAAEALKILEPLATDSDVSSDRALLVQVLYQTGLAHFQLNEYPKALDCFQRAKPLSEALPDRSAEARVLLGTAQAHKNQGAYSMSIAEGGDALRLYRELNDRAEMARTLMLIGSVQDLTGKHREALESYQSALQLFDGAKTQTANRLLNEIGITLKNLGNYKEALDYYTRALDAQVEIGDRYGQAVTLSNTGVLYQLLGDDDLAVEYFRRSLVITREIGERRGQSMLLGNLGEILFDRGDYQGALDYYQQEVQLTEQLGNRNERANALKSIGDIYAARGDVPLARRSYDAALAIQRDIGARSREGSTLLALADLDSTTRTADRTMELARQALQIAYDTDTPELEWKARLRIARAARTAGQADEALDELRAGARIINDLRANISGDVAKIGFVDQRQEVFQELAGTLVSAGRPDEALEAAEAGRARAFADLLEQRHVRAKPAEQQALTAFRDAVEEARAPVAPGTRAPASSRTDPRHPSSAPDRRGGDALEASVAALRAEHRELTSLLTAESPTRAEIIQVAARLQATLVEYLVTERQLLAWVVSPGGVVREKTVDAGRRRLETIVRDVRKEIAGLRTGTMTPSARPNPGLRELHQLLIEPLAAWLPASADALVVVIPDGPLALVPFAALEDAAGRPFIAEHTLGFAPSISVYRYTPDKRRSRPLDSALVVADPLPPPGSGLPSLVGAREEGRLVARRLRPAAVELLTGARASEAAVKREAGHHRLLHFATHGLISAEKPLASSLLLAAGDGEDGYLRVDEIFSLPLSADLVVLSGCSTGLGRLSQDGIVGLSRAFIYAGTPSVLVSQWDVSDRATAYLMDRFYAHVRQPLNAAAALRAAQLATRRRFPDPALWAAFELIGEPK